MDESFSEKFFSNSSKKNTQSKLKEDKNSINCGLLSPKDLTTTTGRLNLLAKTLAVTLLPVPFVPLRRIPKFPLVF